MNKQRPGGIGWCDYTWSPVTGCWGPGGTAEKPNRCSYCYAQRMAGRFVPGDSYEGHDLFVPKFHPERLSQPGKVGKPSKIFVCSMGDLFGDWVPEWWYPAIFETVLWSPQHIFLFLTKNPKRLLKAPPRDPDLPAADSHPWPSNCWVGVTVTNQADADERIPWLLKVDAPVRFVSHEPLLGAIDTMRYWALPFARGQNNCLMGHPLARRINWAIIGAMTGPGAVKPDPRWVQFLLEQYQMAGIPVFIKDNLKGLVGCGLKDCPREFPP